MLAQEDCNPSSLPQGHLAFKFSLWGENLRDEGEENVE